MKQKKGFLIDETARKKLIRISVDEQKNPPIIRSCAL